MLLSDDTNKNTSEFIEAQLDPAHINLLSNMTVKLSGGVKDGSFTGSGVIFAVKTNQTFVLTAKHNLHIAAKKTGLSSSELADYFQRKVSVVMEKYDGGTQSGQIVNIRFFDNTPDNYHYDVCMLEVGGVGGQTFALEVKKYLDRRGLSWLFTSIKWQHLKKGKAAPLFDLFSTSDAQEILANGWGFPRKGMSDFTLLQLGYGKLSNSNMASYGFKRRAIPLKDVAGKSTLLSKTKEGFENVFTFPSSDNDTALSGDSGGPIFAIDSTGTRSTLIGLHLGANFYKNKVDKDEDPTDNNAFSLVTSDLLGLA